MNKNLTTFVRNLASIAVFIGLWEAIGRAGIVSGELFPPPSQVARALIDWAQDSMLLDVTISVWRAVQGWLYGSLAAIGVGMVTGRIEIMRGYITPIVNLFRPMPPVAIIPVIIVWFGIGEASKIFSIAFAVFFPVWINTHLGSQRIPNSFVWTAKTLKASWFTIFWKVIFPRILSTCLGHCLRSP